MLVQLNGIMRQVIISSCLYLGQLIIGFSLSWPGPIIPKLRDLEQSPIPYLLTETQLSFIATIIYIGGVIGPYVTLWLSNTRGRKPCLIGGGVISLIAYIILALSKNLYLMYIGRFMAGIAVGTNGVMNLVYLGEVASKSIRGILLTGLGIFNTLGAILLFSAGPFISYERIAYIAVVLNLIYIIATLYIPESPIFYILQGKDEAVTEVLGYLGRLDEADELLQMKKEFSGLNTTKEWNELFTVRRNRKSLYTVVIINIFQHCSGMLPVVFFSAAIFKMAGSSLSSDVSMIVIGCFQLLGCMVTPFFIERIGRKIILLSSCVVCSLTMFTLGLYFYLDHTGNITINSIKWLPLVLLILFFIGYDSGIGIIPNVLLGEMFGTNVRSKGSTVTMTSSWLFGFLVATVFGAFLETIGGYVSFWFFSCVSAGAFVFTLIFIPETKGKTLMEIQEAL